MRISLHVALFITFLVLKLCEVINWSWWWVTAPLWGPFAIVVLFFLAALAIVVIFPTRKPDEPWHRLAALRLRVNQAK